MNTYAFLWPSSLAAEADTGGETFSPPKTLCVQAAPSANLHPIERSNAMTKKLLRLLAVMLAFTLLPAVMTMMMPAAIRRAVPLLMMMPAAIRRPVPLLETAYSVLAAYFQRPATLPSLARQSSLVSNLRLLISTQLVASTARTSSGSRATPVTMATLQTLRSTVYSPKM